jgi:hypothetical protein
MKACERSYSLIDLFELRDTRGRQHKTLCADEVLLTCEFLVFGRELG